MEKNIRMACFAGLMMGIAATVSAEPIGQVYEAKVVGFDNSPSIQNATQKAPLMVKLRFEEGRCWAVADVVPLSGDTHNNVSGRLRGIECEDGSLKDRRGFAAGYFDPEKPGIIWIAIFD